MPAVVVVSRLCMGVQIGASRATPETPSTAIDSLLPIHEAQLLSYLKLGGWKIGLLINFNVELLKHGIRRRVLNLLEKIEL